MKSLVSSGLAVLLTLAVAPVSQAGIIQPTLPINGISQAELSARWWQWGVSYPDGANPIQDTTGAFSYLGADQTPVSHPGIFFLAGNFGTPSTRTVTIGPNQYLFFPLVDHHYSIAG